MKNLSIKNAVKAYLEVNGNEFSGSELIAFVRNICGFYQTYDATIMRKMRELRSEFRVICIDNRKSRYKIMNKQKEGGKPYVI